MDRQPRTTLVLLLLTSLFVATAAGEAAAVSDHEIHVDDGEADVEVTFELYAEDPDTVYTGWSSSVSVPEDAEIHGLTDSQGEITEYDVTDGSLSFETNAGPPRNKEVVTLDYTADVQVDTVAGFDVVDLDLVGFEDVRDDAPDETTQATVTAEEDVLSWSHSHGFTSDVEGDSLVYSGTGSATVRVVVGEDDGTHDHYTVSGDHELREADDLYPTVAAALGFRPPVESHPVVVLPDDEYDEEVNPWSAGQHRTGGLIILRETEAESSDSTSTLLHETAHTYNSFAFTWSREDVDWFDEGTAQYVEFLVDRRRGEVRSELFGDERRERATCPDGTDDCVRTVPPRGDADELWSYLEDDEEFMVTWRSEDERRRSYGYAFSELVVREHVHRHGSDSLHEIYQEMTDFSERVDDAERASRRTMDVVDTELKPCDRESRDAFERCITEVNTMDAVVPEFEEQQRERIQLQEIEMPEPEPQQTSEPHWLIQLIADVLNDVVDFVHGLLEPDRATAVTRSVT